jgi:hypothetical protein
MPTPTTIRPAPFLKNHPVSLLTNWHSLSKFVTAPKAYKVVGLLRQDMAFGLLAIAPNGEYVRVNGSYVEPIHPMHVEWLCAALKMPRPSIRIKAQRQPREHALAPAH